MFIHSVTVLTLYYSKHMDKHDRPYKCKDPECEKLAGFTYSGGLLRHQREVHKMHAQGKGLMCPIPSCSRSTGKGFTRQENLKEHIRRLHRGYEPTIRDAPDVSGNADADAAGLRTNNTSVLVSHPPRSPKRRRLSVSSGHASEDDIQALRDEIRRLRRENLEKDERLDELEKIVRELRQKIHPP